MLGGNFLMCLVSTSSNIWGFIEEYAKILYANIKHFYVFYFLHFYFVIIQDLCLKCGNCPSRERVNSLFFLKSVHILTF